MLLCVWCLTYWCLTYWYICFYAFIIQKFMHCFICINEMLPWEFVISDRGRVLDFSCVLRLYCYMQVSIQTHWLWSSSTAAGWGAVCITLWHRRVFGTSRLPVAHYEHTCESALLFCFCRAMLESNTTFAIMWGLFVCLSVHLSRSCILWKWVNISSKFFSPSGSPTILVFLYQTAWQYSDSNPPDGGLECRWDRLKSQFSTNIWLCDQ